MFFPLYSNNLQAKHSKFNTSLIRKCCPFHSTLKFYRHSCLFAIHSSTPPNNNHHPNSSPNNNYSEKANAKTMSLDQLFNLSKPQFPLFRNRDKSTTHKIYEIKQVQCHSLNSMLRRSRTLQQTHRRDEGYFKWKETWRYSLRAENCPNYQTGVVQSF